MARIRIKQVRSVIKCTPAQKATMVALGLRRLHRTVEKEATPQIMGMIEKVKHLVEVEKAS